MREEINLVLATVDDAEGIHQMKYEAFLPLYEKYRDDETSPVKESLDTTIWKITNQCLNILLGCDEAKGLNL